MSLSRRGFLQAGLAVGGGLLVEFWPEAAQAATPVTAGVASFTPSAFLRITSDDVVRLIVSRVEMGQGTTTMQAQLLAEELEVAPSAMVVEFAGADRAYDNPKMAVQLTGGSNSTSTSWEPYRHAGAFARELLISAAAKTWGVSRTECFAQNGAIVHRPSKKELRYGVLCEQAASMSAPPVALRQKDFKVVGQSTPRVDAHQKVTGTATFGIDVQVPGAKVAVLVRSPVPGGTVKSWDAVEAQKLGGVSHVVQISRGIAVVGETYFHARRAAQALKVEWDDGALGSFDSVAFHEQQVAALRGTDGKRVHDVGDAVETLKKHPDGQLEAEYFAPFLAHAPMEPQNATAWVRDGSVEIWAPTQGPMLAAEQVARLLDVPLHTITVHQTFLGGGFGRRITQDYVLEAAEVSKAIGGPVKVVWSREDDMRHSPYRPAAAHRVRGVLDASGKPLAWHHRVATQSLITQALPAFAGGMLAGPFHFLRGAVVSMGTSAVGGRDPTAFEGVETLPYAMDHLAVDFVPLEPGIPVTFWRSVGHSHTAFATESFIDELAHAAKQDPFEFRRSLLPKQHRHRWVLELVAEKLGWKTPAPEGIGRGIAVHKSFESYAAAAVEIALDGTTVVVKRAVLAIDCGRVVNPDIVKAQMESAAVFGLSAAMKQKITFEEGRVQQSNFHDFAPLRLGEAPVIETYIRENEAEPTGVGEPGVPVMAPALANAIFALTGKRLRTLPLSLESA